jgi:SAM-dependent methyltransferase
MPNEGAVADHWAKGDVYTLVLSALEKAGKTPDSLTVEDLAPVDHFHARGLPATIDLANVLTVTAGHHILDIGCGLGGPARYFAARFGCRVTGIDITPAFVEAARKLTALVGLESRVTIDQGDGQNLPYADNTFDGAYSQHVTMNVADRPQFFREAFRVVRSGGFFALTEHGLGPEGEPHFPLPWSEDGSGSYLIRPSETRAMLEAAGFVEVAVEDTGETYLAAYRRAIALAESGAVPPLGTHILMGRSAPEKTRNAARNIEERRTRPVQVLCRKPA